MANPRRKNSKARTGKRRSLYYRSLDKPTIMECPQCGTGKLFHRVCPSCGTYRGRQIIESEADA